MRVRDLESWARRRGSERKAVKVGPSMMGLDGWMEEGSGRGKSCWM